MWKRRPLPRPRSRPQQTEPQHWRLAANRHTTGGGTGRPVRNRALRACRRSARAGRDHRPDGGARAADRRERRTARLLASPLIDVNTAGRAVRAVLSSAGVRQDRAGFRRRGGGQPPRARAAQHRRRLCRPGRRQARRGGGRRSKPPHPLTDLQEQQLRARLIEAGYGRVNIVKRVDPSLLGGLVVKVGARLYDTVVEVPAAAPAVRHEGSRLRWRSAPPRSRKFSRSRSLRSIPRRMLPRPARC